MRSRKASRAPRWRQNRRSSSGFLRFCSLLWQLLHHGCRHLDSSALQLINYFRSINCIEGPCIRLLFTDGLQVAAVFYCVLSPGIATAFVHRVARIFRSVPTLDSFSSQGNCLGNVCENSTIKGNSTYLNGNNPYP